MVNIPGLPNAAMTRWISFIQLFDFELRHVPAERHAGLDGLSRRPRALEDSSDTTNDPDEGGLFICGVRPLVIDSFIPFELTQAEYAYVESARLHFDEEDILITARVSHDIFPRDDGVCDRRRCLGWK